MCDPVRWCKKKSGEPSTELADAQAVDAFAADAPAVLIGLVPRGSAEFNELQKVAMGLDDIPVGHSSAPEVLNKYGNAKFVMLQKFDQGVQKFAGEATAENLRRWAVIHSLPGVVEFNRDTQPRIFGKGSPSKHLLVLCSAR